jgi:uncharacterized membrane protein
MFLIKEMTMIRGILGAIVGIALTYLCGAVVAWSFNPGEWGGFWRLWCLAWAIFWAIVVAKMFYEIFEPKRKVTLRTRPRTLPEDIGATRRVNLRTMDSVSPFDKA